MARFMVEVRTILFFTFFDRMHEMGHSYTLLKSHTEFGERAVALSNFYRGEKAWRTADYKKFANYVADV